MDLYEVMRILKDETVQKFPSSIPEVEFRKAIWVAIHCVDNEITRQSETGE